MSPRLNSIKNPTDLAGHKVQIVLDEFSFLIPSDKSKGVILTAYDCPSVQIDDFYWRRLEPGRIENLPILR